jgi:hypothetical protein
MTILRMIFLSISHFSPSLLAIITLVLANNPVAFGGVDRLPEAPVVGDSSAVVIAQKKNGLASILMNSGNLASFNFIGWSNNWQWDNPQLSKVNDAKNLSPEKRLLTFNKQSVDIQLNVTPTPNQVSYKIDLKFNQNLASTIGGGIEFNIDNHVGNNSTIGQPPTLLEQNRGWKWKINNTSELIVEFEPALPELYFERNDKNRIRAWLFRDSVEVGGKSYLMKVTLSDHKYVKYDKHSNDVLARIDLTNDWIKRDARDLTTPADLSYLNHRPAGKHGFVRADNEHLIFANGEQARFFGVNIQAESLFIKDKDLVKKHAQRLAKMGFNLVRLHHHDSAMWVKNSLIAPALTTQQINTQSLDAYHWWIKCLKDEGIYVWLDLQVSRPWREGDRIPGWGSDFVKKNGMADGKGMIYLSRRMIELSKRFNETLLLTTNPYTNLKLTDDPAVMSVMITNENDLTFHFGNSLLNKEEKPYHARLFEQEVQKFSALTPYWQRTLKKTWLPGPSKILLNDIEARFNLEMITHLRSIGLKVPISTTSIFGREHYLYSLPALTTGDIVDVHSYASKAPLFTNPLEVSNFVQSIGYAQVAGKPFSVSEYNSGENHAKETSHIIMPFTAAHAAFQGWDAIMLYGYSQDGFNGRKASPWSSYSDPTFLDLSYASSLLYRAQHIAKANNEMVISGLEDKIFSQAISPKTSLSLRTLTEQHKVTTAMPRNTYLPWLRESTTSLKSKKVNELQRNFLSKRSSIVNSDTNQISRNWETGLVLIDAPKSQGSIGTSGLSKVKLTSVSYSIEPKNSTVFFSSLDDQDISMSRNLLLTTVGRIQSRSDETSFDVFSKRVTGSFTLKSKIPNLIITPLNGNSKNALETHIKVENNDYIYQFDIAPNSDASLHRISSIE